MNPSKIQAGRKVAKSRRQTASRRGDADQKSEAIGRYHQPSARECALLILRLMQAREQEVVDREVSRARISQCTLRRLCGRSQITNDLLLESPGISAGRGLVSVLRWPNSLRDHQAQGRRGLGPNFERPHQGRAHGRFARAL